MGPGVGIVQDTYGSPPSDLAQWTATPLNLLNKPGAFKLASVQETNGENAVLTQFNHHATGGDYVAGQSIDGSSTEQAFLLIGYSQVVGDDGVQIVNLGGSENSPPETGLNATLGNGYVLTSPSDNAGDQLLFTEPDTLASGQSQIWSAMQQ